MTLPDTRNSLLLRIQDSGNQQAWEEFAELYRPVIVRLARQKGLQPADADDLAQQVLWNVAGAIERWEPDSQRARFRTWLRKITENAILNALTRRKPDQAGRGEADVVLSEQAVSSTDAAWIKTEFRREIFQRAATAIRSEFAPATWQAFWMTAVEGVPVDDAVSQLKSTRASVYAARSRVMKRLKKEVEKYDER